MAATAVVWLAATRLMGWSGSSAVNNAAAQVQYTCSSSGAVADQAVGVLLLPALCVLQHMQYSDVRQVFLPAGAVVAAVAAGRSRAGASAAAGAGGEPAAGAGAVAAGGRTRSGTMAAAAAGGDQSTDLTAADAARLEAQRQEAQRVVIAAFLQGYEATVSSCPGTPAVQMAGLMGVSGLLQLHAGGTTAVGFAKLLQDTANSILQLCRGRTASGDGSSPAAAPRSSGVLESLGAFTAPSLGNTQLQQPSSSSTSISGSTSTRLACQLPPLQQLLCLLQPALQASDEAKLQAAAVQFLTCYLQAVPDPTLLLGAEGALNDAIALLTSREGAVRDAALGLVQQYLRAPVLEAVCGGQQTAEEAAAAATQAAADGREAALAVATQQQRRLLQLLQELLSPSGGNGSAGGLTAAGAVGTAAEGAVAAKTAVMRATAGLFAGLLGSGCEDIPLLQLLQQIGDDNAQVRSLADTTAKSHLPMRLHQCQMLMSDAFSCSFCGVCQHSPTRHPQTAAFSTRLHVSLS